MLQMTFMRTTNHRLADMSLAHIFNCAVYMLAVQNCCKFILRMFCGWELTAETLKGLIS